MYVTFRKQAGVEALGINFFWHLTLAGTAPAGFGDHFVPELFYDFLYLEQGEVTWQQRESSQAIPIIGQALKTIHTRGVMLRYELPLSVFGARLSLGFAECLPLTPFHDTFVAKEWLPTGLTTLPDFAEAFTQFAAQMQRPTRLRSQLAPDLAEPDWLAKYSPRHKRRLFRTTYGVSRKDLQSIQNLHSFLGQTCNFTLDNPRIIEYVDHETFYDQPHMNRLFKKMTGLSPLAYFDTNRLLQDNLMAASYNTRSTTTTKI